MDKQMVKPFVEAQLYCCPICGERALEISTVIDDLHDELYPVEEWCLNCGYRKII